MPSNTYFSGAASDWTEHIKDYSTTQDGVSMWDQVLTGLQQNLELQTQAVQASTDYDISQAYANYLQNQRQISQASNLRSGFKEQLESNLQSSYQSAFQQAQVNETQELYNVAQAYQKELTKVENQFAEMGETAAGYAGRLFEYASQYGKYVPGYEDINWSGDLQGQGIYVEDDQGNLVLSDKGKNVLNYLLLNRVSIPGKTEADATSTSFEQWLGETYGDELSGYREYADMIRTGFGMEPGETSFDQEAYDEERVSETIADVRDKAESILSKYDFSNKDLRIPTKQLRYDLASIFDIDESDITIITPNGYGDVANRKMNVTIKTTNLTDIEKNVLLRAGATEKGDELKISLVLGGTGGTANPGYTGSSTYQSFFNDLMNEDNYSIDPPTLTGAISGGGSGGGGVGTF